MEESEEKTDIAEAAKNVLEIILDLLAIPASVMPPTETEEGDTSSIALDITGEDLGILIGRRGQTLASLQYIVRLIVGHQTQIRLPITIDVEGYKQRRYESLRSMAFRMAEQVKEQGTPFSLEPMTPFERRIIHLALADDPDVSTESAGFGEDRKVVILPGEG